MKRCTWFALIVVALLAGVIHVVWAQTKLNFSGTWTYDADKSDQPAAGGRGGGRGGGGMAMTGGDKLVIKQTVTQLVIEQGTMTTTYALDGRESVNAGMGRGGGEQKTKTHWEGDKLVTEGSQSMSGPMGDMTMQFTETRSLSADGKVMTVERTTKSQRGESTRKTVYSKASS